MPFFVSSSFGGWTALLGAPTHDQLKRSTVCVSNGEGVAHGTQRHTPLLALSRRLNSVHAPCRKLRAWRRCVDETACQKSVVATGLAQIDCDGAALLSGEYDTPVGRQGAVLDRVFHVDVDRRCGLEYLPTFGYDLPAHPRNFRVHRHRPTELREF